MRFFFIGPRILGIRPGVSHFRAQRGQRLGEAPATIKLPGRGPQLAQRNEASRAVLDRSGVACAIRGAIKGHSGIFDQKTRPWRQ